jgi:hypothetical protein
MGSCFGGERLLAHQTQANNLLARRSDGVARQDPTLPTPQSQNVDHRRGTETTNHPLSCRCAWFMLLRHLTVRGSASTGVIGNEPKSRSLRYPRAQQGLYRMHWHEGQGDVTAIARWGCLNSQRLFSATSSGHLVDGV